MSKNIVIVDACRTPLGGFQGVFSNTTAPKLAATATESVMTRTAIGATDIDEVLFGCVLSAGLAQAPARQAAIYAGIDKSTPCTTVNKICGSGMKSVMLAHDLIRADSARTVLAGGMENMTLAPYLLPKARSGMRLGHGETKDHMFYDGLEDAYSGRLMGSFAQDTADDNGISREQMDDFAIRSLQRAQRAQSEGDFVAEIAPVTLSTRRGEVIVNEDEQPPKLNAEKIPSLKPAFAKEGTITAANSSSIADGAAALLLMDAELAKEKRLEPLARIVAHSSHAQEPSEYTLAPIGGIEKVLRKAQWSISDVDLFEINEAFALVTLLAINRLQLDADKVNVNGGACALGHPIGASGARILVTLLHALKRRKLTRGVASLCIGGGEATAVAVEML